MKILNLNDFINEAHAATDPYVDLPEIVKKYHKSPWESKEFAKEAKEKYKEYVKTAQQINGDNLEILVARLKEAVINANGNKAFKLMADECKFDRYYFEREKEHDFFEEVETALSYIRASLELDDFSMTEFKHTRKNDRGEERNIAFWNSDLSYTANLYKWISKIAAAYNVEMPKFDKDIALLSTSSADERFDEWRNDRPSFRKISDRAYDAARERAQQEYERDSKKIRKAREAFRKTELYKDLNEILDIVENDLKAADNDYINWADKMAEKARKDAYEKQIQDAIEKVSDYVKSKIEKELDDDCFCYGQTSLYRLAAIAYVEDGDMPTIVVKSSKTGSWMSGMRHTATFEVIGKNDKSFGEVTMEDYGITDHGRSVDGFGAWD